MINDIINDCKQRMEKSINSLTNAFAKIRAGRAHPALLEHIQVDYYGSLTPLNQVANITVEDARSLKVSPWEKEMVAVVEKAIIKSDLGLNPHTQGQVIRIPLPPLTSERRAELVRVVKDEAEAAKVSMRNIRRDANGDIKELLKEKEISEDESRSAETRIQKVTDEYVVLIDAKLTEKESSLTEM